MKYNYEDLTTEFINNEFSKEDNLFGLFEKYDVISDIFIKNNKNISEINNFICMINLLLRTWLVDYYKKKYPALSKSIIAYSVERVVISEVLVTDIISVDEACSEILDFSTEIIKLYNEDNESIVKE